MAFVHNISSDSLKSELDLFAVPLTQTSVEGGSWVHYKPVTALGDSSVIDFVVEGRGDAYIDPAHTLIQISAKITNADGSNLADDANVAPTNYWLHSLFGQVDVYLNQKLITPSANTYPYRAYIEACLGYDSGAKSTHLQNALWYKDTAGQFEATAGANAGFAKRKSLVAGSREVVLMGRLHSDIFKQDRFILNGVEMGVKLIRSRDAFNLVVGTAALNVKVVITDATLLVRKVRINPSVLIAHSRALEKATAKYPITRVDVKTVTIPAQLQAKSVDNLILGALPKRIVIGFVLNTSFNGTKESNPFNFQHFNLNHLVLYVDGNQIPSKPLSPSFEANSSAYVPMYQNLIAGCGIHSGDHGNDISREEFGLGGFCLTSFDLTPDLSANSGVWGLQRHGNLRLEVQFSAALAHPVNCIVYAEYDSLVEIDFERNVTADFGI